MKKLSYTTWHIYLAKELEKDYKKLGIIPKKQKHENKLQTVSSR